MTSEVSSPSFAFSVSRKKKKKGQVKGGIGAEHKVSLKVQKKSFSVTFLGSFRSGKRAARSSLGTENFDNKLIKTVSQVASGSQTEQPEQQGKM